MVCTAARLSGVLAAHSRESWGRSRAEQPFGVRVDAKAAAPGGLNIRQEASCLLSRVARDRELGSATTAPPQARNKTQRFRSAVAGVRGSP
jgi:hypothetical protein